MKNTTTTTKCVPTKGCYVFIAGLLSLVLGAIILGASRERFTIITGLEIDQCPDGSKFMFLLSK